jgi:peptidoglycan/LPS O-acetylase OafA/YrhL
VTGKAVAVAATDERVSNAPPSHERELPSDGLAQAHGFRPDIQGLRAIAVMLVVLYHAGVPGINGGYVGVDVFFVLSGFLITDLLLRERSRTGTTSLPRFYARRVRRILPAATIVLLATVFASYYWLGFIRGGSVARDAQWTSVFLANIHFAEQGTNYLNTTLPPSPLQHYWTLGVEEQFYIVWPTLFLLVAVVLPKVGLRLKLGVVLILVTCGSFVWSVIETQSNGAWAFYSPLTRAWELSIGALLALFVPLLLGVPHRMGCLTGWLGIAGIVFAAFWLDATTPYPGFAVALPVIATACAVAGGTIASGRGGPESLLKYRPFQVLGAVSFSLYLWHWPLLTIVAQHEGRSLSLGTSLSLVAVAIALSCITYVVVENPIRYAKRLVAKPARSLAVGIGLILVSLGVASAEIASHPSPKHGIEIPQ